MNDEVEKLRQQVNDLAGRAIVDGAMLRQAVLSASTPQLRSTHGLIGKLGDEVAVKALLRSYPLASKAFEDQKRAWQALITQEIASRDAASPQN